MWKTFCALLCGSLMAANVLAAENILPYGLKSGKPYAGTTLNILSVVTLITKFCQNFLLEHRL